MEVVLLAMFLGWILLHTVAAQVYPPANEPPELFVSRDWKIPADKKVGDLITRLVAKDRDGDKLKYGIRPSPHLDGSSFFFVDADTGVVYLTANFSEKVDSQFYLQATVSDGRHLTSKDIWVEVVPSSNASGDFQHVPHRNTRPILPQNVSINNDWHIGFATLPPKRNRTDQFTGGNLDHLEAGSDDGKIGTGSVNTTVAPQTATDGTESALNLTPIVVPLVVLIVLVPILGYFVYRGKQRWTARKRLSVKSDNYSLEFQKRFSTFGATPIEKSLEEESRTWRFDQRGINAANWEIGKTNMSFMENGGAPIGGACVVGGWEFPRHQLRIISQLGEGCFGQVWRCEALNLAGVEGVSTVAVKTLKESALEKEKKDLLMELEVMKLLDPHPNVVTLLGCCTEKDPVFVIMEYVSRGKLQTFLRDSRVPLDYNNLHGGSASLNSRDLTTFAHQIARGMHYLTEKGIIHRDLAARNVLVSEERICKVADFGFARDVIGNHVYERKTEGRLPIRWMAPESLYDNLFTAKSDVWSFGVLLWEIVTLGSTPYPGMSAQEVMKKVREGYRLEKPEHCRRELFNLMYYCWSAEAETRPSFGEVVETLEKLLLSEMDYIELDRFPEHSYYNLAGLSGEKV